MPSYKELLDQLHARWFTSRERELALFRQWLNVGDDVPAILNVYGPGGIGKSELVRAFAREAASSGWRVRLVDGHDVGSSPELLLAALGAADSETAAQQLNAERALLLFDTFEESIDLSPFLQEELLARLDLGVRVVIAGRYPLHVLWPLEGPWGALIQPLELPSLNPVDSDALLARRGVADPGTRQQIIAVAGGFPLALTIAADLVQRSNANPWLLDGGTDWHRVERGMVDRLLQHVSCPAVRGLIEAAAIVRQFDEESIAAISGLDDVAAPFDRLSRLSIVQGAEYGLMLHDAVRQVLLHDLEWRQPERVREMRRRAVRYYRGRLRSSFGRERAWLVLEYLHLWSDAFVNHLLFTTPAGGDVWIRDAIPSDHPRLLALWEEWRQTVHREVAPDEGTRIAQDRPYIADLLRFPALTARVAVNSEGEILGFTTSVRVYAESARLLSRSRLFGSVIAAYRTVSASCELPTTPDEANVFCLLQIVFTDRQMEAVRAALLRDLSHLFASGGIYLTGVLTPAHRRLAEACGFVPIHQAGRPSSPGAETIQSYVLDLTHEGIEAWIDGFTREGGAAAPGVTSGVPAPAAAPRDTPPRSSDMDRLTRREREIAILILRGGTNLEIARALSIGERTVETHVTNILTKLGFTSRTQIAAWVVGQGLPPSAG